MTFHQGIVHGVTVYTIHMAVPRVVREQYAVECRGCIYVLITCSLGQFENDFPSDISVCSIQKTRTASFVKKVAASSTTGCIALTLQLHFDLHKCDLVIRKLVN